MISSMRERDGRDRRVERGGDAGGGADGDQALTTRGRLAGQPAERGANAGADLDGRPFAAEREARTDRQGAEDELADDRAQGELRARPEQERRFHFGNAVVLMVFFSPEFRPSHPR